MKFIATAEHTAGTSVGHPCSKGIYSDPTDHWEEDIEARDEEDAQHKAFKSLQKLVSDYPACDCRRKLEPGSNRWWNSVIVTVTPTE